MPALQPQPALAPLTRAALLLAGPISAGFRVDFSTPAAGGPLLASTIAASAIRSPKGTQ